MIQYTHEKTSCTLQANQVSNSKHQNQVGKIDCLKVAFGQFLLFRWGSSAAEQTTKVLTLHSFLPYRQFSQSLALVCGMFCLKISCQSLPLGSSRSQPHFGLFVPLEEIHIRERFHLLKMGKFRMHERRLIMVGRLKVLLNIQCI